jgi:hypothetical protein
MPSCVLQMVSALAEGLVLAYLQAVLARVPIESQGKLARHDP